MQIEELNYLTLLWIEQLAGVKIDNSNEHMKHALRDFIYATEVLRGIIRVQMDLEQSSSQETKLKG